MEKMKFNEKRALGDLCKPELFTAQWLSPHCPSISISLLRPGHQEESQVRREGRDHLTLSSPPRSPFKE